MKCSIKVRTNTDISTTLNFKNFISETEIAETNAIEMTRNKEYLGS